MRAALRFLGMVLSLGAIASYGSEVLFWSFPPDDAGIPGMLATIPVYGLAMALTVAAMQVTRAGGVAGLVLAGAILGFVIEGIVVSTMYDAFPVQLVWTPLAWHQSVTMLAILVLPRRLARQGIARQVAALAGLGLLGGAWASYWPTERAELPPAAAVLAYQCTFGALAVLGQVALDRLGPLGLPKALVWLLAGLALAVWLVQGAADPRPERLSLPVMAGLTLWAMRRLGRAAPRPVSLGPPAPALRHLPFLIVPLLVSAAAGLLVQGGTGTAANVAAILTLGPLGLGLWVWALWRGYRASSRSAAARSIAPS